MHYHRRKTITAATLQAAMLALILPGVALAGVVTGQTPSVPAIAVPIGANTTPKAEMNDNAQATGALSESSAQVWQKTIAAPPSARIQNRSLQAMQKALVSAYQAGQLQTLPPIAGSGGEILYAYGNSLPTLVTAPLHTSIIQLQPGCHPSMASGAPASRWVLHAVTAGDQPEITVMPKFEGLHTDLVIPAIPPAASP